MTVFPTAYFPSIVYLQAFIQSENPFIEWHEHFEKQSIRSRCEILTANGVLRLSVPIIHSGGQKTPIHKLQIDHQGTWKNDHWRAIQSAYAQAPYFEDYASEIKEIIFSPDEFLWQKNERCLHLLEKVLAHKIPIQYTQHFYGSMHAGKKTAFLEKDHWEMAEYQQVFSYEKPFTPNLSMIDLLLNEGPFIRKWILSSENKSVPSFGLK